MPKCGLEKYQKLVNEIIGSAGGATFCRDLEYLLTSNSTLLHRRECRGPQPSAGVWGVPKNSLFFSPPQVAKRIALYWHNGRSLGHTVRSATLGQALITHIPTSIVVGITGASKGFELLPPAMDLVKIPSYLTYDSSEGVCTTPVLPVAKEQFHHIRENLISTFVNDFQPHALIVDFHPEGKNGELIPTVLNSPKTHKILGLRGILGSTA